MRALRHARRGDELALLRVQLDGIIAGDAPEVAAWIMARVATAMGLYAHNRLRARATAPDRPRTPARPD